MFGGNILILEPLRLGQSRLESGLQVIGRINIGPALNGGTAHQLRFQFPHQSTHLHTGFFQQRRNDSVGLSHQSQSQMLTVESRMVMILGPGLGCLNGLLGLLGQFIECHCCPTASTMPPGAHLGSKENRPEWCFCSHSGPETVTNRVNPTQSSGQADARPPLLGRSVARDRGTVFLQLARGPQRAAGDQVEKHRI